MSRMRVRYLERWRITAALHACPARLVPPPRLVTGTPKRRQIPIVAMTSSTVRGTTTPTGTCRKFDASVA
jgi:hypothetical protein